MQGRRACAEKLAGVHVKWMLSLSDINGNSSNSAIFFLFLFFNFAISIPMKVCSQLVHSHSGVELSILAGAPPVCGRPKCP